jgi:hypothetical protein
VYRLRATGRYIVGSVLVPRVRRETARKDQRELGADGSRFGDRKTMSTFYFVPGMMYPYWIVTDDNAHNLDADTDMGDLSVDEFTEWFLHRARRITHREAVDRSVTP